jgi:VIT family
MPDQTRRRILEPSERFSEVLFGLIMVLTFTGSLSVAESSREDVRTMLIGAIGCNLAWGIVDAIMYLLNTLGERGQGIKTFLSVRAAALPEKANALIAGVLPSVIAGTLSPDDLETIRKRLVALPDPPPRAWLDHEDFIRALAVFLFVFLSTFPVVIPFLLVRDAALAKRLSNGVAIVLLFIAGYSLGRHTGKYPWRLGLSMVGIGLVLVAITIALGG